MACLVVKVNSCVSDAFGGVLTLVLALCFAECQINAFSVGQVSGWAKMSAAAIPLCGRVIALVCCIFAFLLNTYMDKLLTLVLALLLFYGAASCSSSPTDNNKPDTTKKDTLRDSAVFVGKDYDTTKGGLQIIKIYYDQDSNEGVWKFKDEVILLVTDTPVFTTNWMLDADDEDQRYNLPPYIEDSLYIYTHTRQGRWSSEFDLKVSGSRWIWNNSEPDTARILGPTGDVIDSYSYDVK
jgi:hypothetical protein